MDTTLSRVDFFNFLRMRGVRSYEIWLLRRRFSEHDKIRGANGLQCRHSKIDLYVLTLTALDDIIDTQIKCYMSIYHTETEAAE